MRSIRFKQTKYACLKLAFAVLLAAAITTPVSLPASHSHEHRVDTDSRLSGASLETEFWERVRDHDADMLSDLIASLFLGGNASGSISRDAELAGLAGLNFDSFSINNVVESQSDDIRIITYNFVTSGQNAINDQRVSVWQRLQHKHHQYSWQWISHTNSSSSF
jgi:hypothetical protein